MCVTKIFDIFAYLSCDRINWCCVASPQSNNHISLSNLSAKLETFLVKLGAPLEVPKNVNSTPLKFDLRSRCISSPPATASRVFELNIVC